MLLSLFACFVALCFANQIDFSLYHTTDEIYAQVRSLVNSVDIFRLVEVPLGPGEHLQLVSISDYTHEFGHTRDKIRVLVNCGEHGRELITSEIALQFLHFFIQGERQKKRYLDGKSSKLFSNSFSSPTDSDVFSSHTIQFLLRNVEFFLIPLTSPWARIQVENGKYCNRKTKNLVDLNRNWDYLWKKTGSPLAANDDQYSGEKPFSEPESRAVRDIAVKLKPHMYINVHSGSRDLFTGWDHRQELVPNSDEVLRLLRYLSHSYLNCSVGGAGIGGGYVVFGGSMDYLYDYLKVNYSFTWEVAGGVGSIADCYRFFNPSRKDEFKSTVEMWVLSLASSALFLLNDKLQLFPPFAHSQQWVLDHRLMSKMISPPSTSLSSSVPNIAVLGGMEWDNVFTGRVALDFAQQQQLPPGISVIPSPFAQFQHEIFFGAQSSSPTLCYQDMSKQLQQKLISLRKSIENDLDQTLGELQPSVIIVLHSSTTATEPSLSFEAVSSGFESLLTADLPEGFSVTELSDTVLVSTVDLARLQYTPRDFVVHLTFAPPTSFGLSPNSQSEAATTPSVSTRLASYVDSGRMCTFFEHNPARTLGASELLNSVHFQKQLGAVVRWIASLQSPTPLEMRPTKKRVVRDIELSSRQDDRGERKTPIPGRYLLFCAAALAIFLCFVLKKRAVRAKFHL